MLRTWLLVSLFVTTLLACNPDRIQYTDRLKQEMSDKRVQRITGADLSQAVDSWGAQIVTIAQQEAESKLAGGATANLICTLQDLPKTQALAHRYGMNISLLGADDVQNPKLAKKERDVLDAYLYNAENKLTQSSNIQPVGDTLFVYNAVVPAGSALEKTCYGQQKQPLAVWRLAFTKAEIIRHLKLKK